ncbi:MAG: serine--tRNA ligase [Puniceicoccales bacterium]|jgi:seryl-tRNA synthetase|nr:serine--tRNA ligase [Puniceicoccales bacterium]
MKRNKLASHQSAERGWEQWKWRIFLLQKLAKRTMLPPFMLELKYLRTHGEEIKAALAKKKFRCDIDAFLELDRMRREYIGKFEAERATLNVECGRIGAMAKVGEISQKERGELRKKSAKIKQMEGMLRDMDTQWQRAYLSIPNIPHDSVPVGKGAEDNVVISTWGNGSNVSPHAIPHHDIPWFSRAIDFPRGVKVAGAGFPFYIGAMARLVRSIIQFFLHEAKNNGYEEMLPPIFVNEASATATGQLPDKEGMMYEMPTDRYYAVPTAEVPLTNFFRDEILDEKELPVMRCAYTPCFRREAGSWGKDVRGLNRLHQFDKVELVKWVHPQHSYDELERLRGDGERLLQKLELPYRVISICSGDIGFPHAKQYDLEVWAGGQKRWLEVSSCSNFTDFQARRANIRYRPIDGSKAQNVHTLNGSGLAVPRVLAALLENNLQKDGSVKIPAILEKWFGESTITF